jgi:SAM-dependent methyltransferase
MNNYEYCSQFIASRLQAGGKVLDYGCGSGKIVSLLRDRGVDAWGCDVFYEGGDYSQQVPANLLGTAIRRMQGDQIPFESGSFDWIVSNQVLEHVPDLEIVVSEMRRVLKPGGFVLSMFPDRGVWREGHCGIPFLHRFPKRSHFRVRYAAALRRLGFGYHTEGREALEWSRNFCEWLDQWTYYRSYEEVHAEFLRRFADVTHYETDWLDERLGSRKVFAAPLPHWLRRLIVQKLMGLVFVATGEKRG